MGWSVLLSHGIIVYAQEALSTPELRMAYSMGEWLKEAYHDRAEISPYGAVTKDCGGSHSRNNGMFVRNSFDSMKTSHNTWYETQGWMISHEASNLVHEIQRELGEVIAGQKSTCWLISCTCWPIIDHKFSHCSFRNILILLKPDHCFSYNRSPSA